MSKPTLVQSLLKQPSKSYTNADSNDHKDYYSTRQEMIRIAGQKTAGGIVGDRKLHNGDDIRYENDRPSSKPSDKRDSAMTRGPGPPMLLNNPRRPSAKILEPEDDSDSDLDMFFTPSTSPRTSMASSVATITFPSSGRRPNRRSLSSLKSVDSSKAAPNAPAEPPSNPSKSANTSTSTRTPSGNARNAISTSSISSTSLDGHSVFSDYTTTTEYYVSDQTVPIGRGTPVRSTSTKTTSSGSKAGTYAHLGVSSTGSGHTKNNAQPVNGKTPDVPAKEGSIQSNSKGKERDVSRAVPHDTTKTSGSLSKSTTTSAPAGRQQQYKPPRPPHTFSAFSTTEPAPASSSTKHRPTASPSTPLNDAAASSHQSRPQSSPENTVTSRSHSNIPSSPATRNNTPKQLPQNPKPAASTSGSSGRSKRIVESVSPSPSPLPLASTQAQQHPRRNNSHKPDYIPAIPAMPTITPLIRGMDAVLEEDEDGPLTPVMEARTLRDQADYWDVAGSYSSSGTPPATSVSATTSNRLRRTTPIRQARPSSVNSASSSTSSLSRSAPKTLTAEVNALVNGFADSDGALPSNGTQGYSSLVLPRAPPPTNGAGRVHKEKEGKVDLTRSGVAQMTMATVEVVRGLGATAGGGGVLGFLGLGRRRSLSTGRGKGPAPIPLRDAGSGSADAGHITGIRYTEPTVLTPLGFTSYRSPPSFVPSSSVLVQVWAVGVDAIDGRLVGAKFGNHYLREGASMLGGDLELVEEPQGMEDDLDADNLEGNGNGHVTDGDDEGDVPSTATVDSTNLPVKKGGLAALGRSLSLRLSRGQSGKKKPDLQRSASAVVYSSTPQTPQTPPSRPPAPRTQSTVDPRVISHPKRSFSLKRSNTAASNVSASASPSKKDGGMKRTESVLLKKEKAYTPDVGYIPGRSFVGRVLECGWEVPDEVVKKGEWVVGLLDVRKGGALAEFIIVDRHRIHRVPHPKATPNLSTPSNTQSSPVWSAAPITANGTPRDPTLSLEELALLPLCGLPAQRAMRTLAFAFSASGYGSTHGPSSMPLRPQFEFGNGPSASAEPRRALVLRGHNGAGAMAVQILAKRGWRVSIHIPYSLVPSASSKEVFATATQWMEERAREWGADEVIFDDGEGLLDDGRGAVVRMLDSIRADGDVFDAVVDTVGGKEVWEAAERLLKFAGAPPRRKGVGQFTTLVGDWPDRIVPRAKDHLRTGLRAMRMGSTDGTHAGDEGGGNAKVGYAWVSVAQDVDWEGDGVAETLGAVIRLALEDGVRPTVDDVEGQVGHKRRVVPFEQSPQAFVDNGLLGNGGTVVVKVAG